MLRKSLVVVVSFLLFFSFVPFGMAHTVSPVDTNAQSTTKSVYNWMTHLPNRTGNRLLSGAFGGYSNDTFSMNQAITVKNATGQTPSIYACDYSRGWLDTPNVLDSINYSCNNDLISHWKNGGFVQVSLHLSNPIYSSGNLNTKITNEQYKRILDSSTTEGKRFESMLSKVADGLNQLKNEGVPVLFRPLHEMNGEWFWWGLPSYNENNPERVDLYKKLYQKVFTYMKDTRGLNNLIWVYSPDANRDYKTSFYPGNNYVDIVGLDAYVDDAYSINGYSEMLSLGKPFAFTEVGPQTTSGTYDYSNFVNAIQQKYPQAVYFLAWDDKWSPASNLGANNLYNNSWTINREEIWSGSSLTPIIE
ncbi:glycosyl hydrolase [Priestia megaterium]